MAAPKADRPHMPGYGITASREGMLPWSWAEERLGKSRNYFVVTTRPDGRPHAMPVWGVFIDGLLCFSTGGSSVKARNLSRQPECVICAEGAEEAAIIEGVAEDLTDDDLFERFRAAYKEKYDWQIDRSLGPIFAVRPRVVFGFIEHESQFSSSATRWRFDD